LVDVKMDIKKSGSSIWTWWNWLRIGASGGLSWTRHWNFGFHKRRRFSRLSEWLLVSHRGLCSIQLSNHYIQNIHTSQRLLSGEYLENLPQVTDLFVG